MDNICGQYYVSINVHCYVFEFLLVLVYGIAAQLMNFGGSIINNAKSVYDSTGLLFGLFYYLQHTISYKLQIYCKIWINKWNFN